MAVILNLTPITNTPGKVTLGYLQAVKKFSCLLSSRNAQLLW